MPKGSMGGKRGTGENAVYKRKDAYKSYREKVYKYAEKYWKITIKITSIIIQWEEIVQIL